METSTIHAIVQTTVMAILGFLFNRSIRSLDDSIKELRDDAKKLNNGDTVTQVAISELRTRIIALERKVFGREQ